MSSSTAPAARWWPLWFLGLPVALATTRGLQACSAPVTLVIAMAGVAAAGLGLARLLEGRRAAARLALIVGLMAASLLPLALSITTDAISNGHDLPLHLWGLRGTAREMAAGNPWPRWHPDLGMGQPLLGFYPPATHWLGGPMLVSGLAPTQAAKLLGWLSGVAAAGGGWLVLRDRGAGLAASGLTAVALIVAPYRLLDLNYRFALGELFGLALVLPLVHFAWRVISDEPGRLVRRPRAALWLALTAMALCHPISGLMAAWATLPILGSAAFARRRAGGDPLPGLLPALGIVALAFATAGAFLVPAAADHDATRVGAQIPDTMAGYRGKALHPTQALVRERWNGRRLSYTLAQERARRAEGKSVEEVPFYLGWGLFLAILLALIPSRTPGGRGPPAAPGLALGALLAWASTFPFAAWVMGRLDVFMPLQFPWRFLGPATALGAGCLGLVFDRWLRGTDRRTGAALAAAAVLVLAWDGLPGYGAGDLLDVRLDTPMFHLVRSEQPHPACRADARGWRRRAVEAEPPALPTTDGGGWQGEPSGDLPPRVWGLLLPPNDLDVPVALAWRAFPEGWSQSIHRSRVGPARRGDRAAARRMGVSRRYRADRAEPEIMEAGARVLLRHAGAEVPLAARVERRRAAWVVLRLPDDHPGGLVLLNEQWMPGWQARVDGGGWQPAGAEAGVLAFEVAEAATRLEFRRDPLRGDRVVGGLLSLIGLLAGLWLARREGGAHRP